METNNILQYYNLEKIKKQLKCDTEDFYKNIRLEVHYVDHNKNGAELFVYSPSDDLNKFYGLNKKYDLFNVFDFILDEYILNDSTKEYIHELIEKYVITELAFRYNRIYIKYEEKDGSFFDYVNYPVDKEIKSNKDFCDFFNKLNNYCFKEEIIEIEDSQEMDNTNQDYLSIPPHYIIKDLGMSSEKLLSILLNDVKFENKMSYFYLGNIYKYLFRFTKKNKLNDLFKAKDYLQALYSAYEKEMGEENGRN